MLRADCRNPLLSIHAEGLIASDAAAKRFTTVIGRPTIQGADVARRTAYAKAAIAVATTVTSADRSAETSPMCWRGQSNRSLTSRSTRYGTAIRRSDRKQGVREGS